MQTIRDVVSRECGSAAQAWLFGSRLDDARRGGDVDLLIELDNPVERPALLSARLSALISRSLGGRRVDVLLSAPNLTRQAVHRVAEEQGQLL
jgi:predicted nucleotidyltransferase